MKPGIPESFRVLVKELQGLGLDVEVQYDDGSVGGMVLEDEDEDRTPRRSYSAIPSEASFFEESKDETLGEPLEETGVLGSEEPMDEDSDILSLSELIFEKSDLPAGMSLVEDEGNDDLWPEEK